MSIQTPKSGTDYGALQANNPYRNAQYTRGFWDNVGDWLNNKTGLQLFKTPEQKFRDQMANQAAAYDAQIGEVQREEAYNSPEEQAQRMRAAGLNPNLESSGITGGQASEFDNQAAAAFPEQQDNSQQIQGFVASLCALPMKVAGLMEAIPNIQNSWTQMLQNRVDAFDKLGEFGESWLLDHVNEFDAIKSQADFIKSDIFTTFMHDDEMKSMLPLYSQRKAAALAMWRKAKSMQTGTDVAKMRGQNLQTTLDPMNFDATLIRGIMTVNAKMLQMQAESKLSEAEWNQHVFAAYSALAQWLSELGVLTGNHSYDLSVLSIQQLQSGKLGNAAAISGVGAAAGALTKVAEGLDALFPDSPEGASGKTRRTPADLESPDYVTEDGTMDAASSVKENIGKLRTPDLIEEFLKPLDDLLSPAHKASREKFGRKRLKANPKWPYGGSGSSKVNKSHKSTVLGRYHHHN